MIRPGMVNLRSFHPGADLGQRVDHTAFVVVEQRVVVSAQKDLASYEYLRERKLYVRMVERVRPVRDLMRWWGNGDDDGGCDRTGDCGE